MALGSRRITPGQSGGGHSITQDHTWAEVGGHSITQDHSWAAGWVGVGGKGGAGSHMVGWDHSMRVN